MQENSQFPHTNDIYETTLIVTEKLAQCTSPEKWNLKILRKSQIVWDIIAVFNLYSGVILS